MVVGIKEIHLAVMVVVVLVVLVLLLVDQMQIPLKIVADLRELKHLEVVSIEDMVMMVVDLIEHLEILVAVAVAALVAEVEIWRNRQVIKVDLMVVKEVQDLKLDLFSTEMPLVL